MARTGYGPNAESIEDNMRETLHLYNILPADQRARFMQLFSKFLEQRRTAIDWRYVTAPPAAVIKKLADVPPCPADAALQHALLDKLVLLKLNGGLGSTMGCLFPKSAIEVRQELSFLDLTVEYMNSLHGVDVPLVLMNSFKTHEVTAKLIRKYHSHNLTIHTFLQNCYPRVAKDTLLPLPAAPFPGSSAQEWYPPGHGDVYYSLFTSGLLESLLSQGKEYVFISNVDNLGAKVDLSVLYHVMCEDIEMCMCVAPRTKADQEGGVLVGFKDRPMLIESVQVPKQHTEDFRKKFTHFNTNNLWVSLRAIQRMMLAGGFNDNVVVQERVVDGIRVLQLETLAGGAIQNFDKVLALEVERSRFLPVKSTSDLLLAQSSLFSVSHGSLLPATQRPLPLVKLGRDFTSLQSYLLRIPHGVPDISELDHLTVAGDVHFGANVRLKGTVIIVANEGSCIMIPDGAVLEDKVVTGHLRILDH